MTWPTRPIGEIATIYDGPHATPTKRTEGPWFLSISSLENGRLKLSESAHLSETDFAQWTRRVIPEQGDLLFSYETKLGAAALMPADLRACLGRRMGLLRPYRDQVLPEFLLYAYLGPNFQAEIKARSIHGATVDRIPLASLKTWPISVPPLKEQQAITEVLGALDEKISVNERLIATAIDLARCKYQAFEKVTHTQISKIAEIFDGPHATPNKTDAGPWFLSVSSLKGGIFDLTESAHMTEEEFPRWTRRVKPSAGDVLFSYETRLGEAALMPAGIRASLGRRMALLRPKTTDVDGALLLHAFLSKEFQEEIRRRTVHGATVDRIPLKEMGTWPIALPSKDDRPVLSRMLSALHSTIEHCHHENHALVDLRDTLLPQLVTGKIRVKDAERIVEDAT
ncbi:restriction endonuclease subunit S [Streptomyces californicus]|uniref:restriction endonuclease subunit S n=1 Tax=Streptomyces californicus TaxID=67351 RepID=UPI003716703D